MKSVRNTICCLAIFLIAILGCSAAVSAAASFVPKQTAATVSSATITWPAQKGAVKYRVYFWEDSDESDTAASYTFDSTTVKFTELKTNTVYRYQISALDSKGKVIGSTPNSYTAYPAPAKVKSVVVSSWGEKKGASFEVSNSSDKSFLTRMDWEIWNAAGTKRLYKGTLKTGSTFKVSGLARTAVYQLKVRGYSGVKDAYHSGPFGGQWYSKTIVPEPLLVSAKRVSGGKAVKMKWKKVAGATKYVIYASKKKDSGYKKVATVGANKTTAVIRKFRKAALSSDTTYYFCIRAYKKSVGSTCSYCAEM